MLFSNRTWYAIRGLSELVIKVEDTAAGHRSRADRVSLNELVEHTLFPREALAKIFKQLVKSGLLRSHKGPGGGYALARPAHQITLLEIMDAVDSGRWADRCVAGLDKCNDATVCPLHDLFEPIRQQLRSYLSTSLANAAANLRGHAALQQIDKTQDTGF